MPVDITISEAVQQLWDLDVNRLDPNEDYKVNVQGGKKPYWKDDNADDPLFTFVDKSALRRPTYRAFIALLDNYTAEVGVTVPSRRVGSGQRCASAMTVAVHATWVRLTSPFASALESARWARSPRRSDRDKLE